LAGPAGRALPANEWQGRPASTNQILDHPYEYYI
jgi:hypothetical protein